jgi:CRISPR/Cas system-associated endonuclease Cas1
LDDLDEATFRIPNLAKKLLFPLVLKSIAKPKEKAETFRKMAQTKMLLETVAKSEMIERKQNIVETGILRKPAITP